jgi:hypothetical protein
MSPRAFESMMVDLFLLRKLMPKEKSSKRKSDWWQKDIPRFWE